MIKKTVATGFGTVSYHIHYSTGPTLVLLHGLAASGKSWGRFIEFISDEFTLIIPDLLGHGDSDAPHIDYHVLFQEEVIREVLQKEEIQNYCLMGHSYGGWIAAILAKNNPSITKLILEDAGGLKGFFDEIVGTEEREQYKKDLLKKALELNAKEYVIRSIINDEFSMSQITTEDLSSITSKTLILWGENDSIIDKKYAYEFQKNIKDSSIILIKTAKHTAHYTNPEEVSKVVMEFINSD